MIKFNIRTEKEGYYNITNKVKQFVRDSSIHSGLCVVFVPHTTAGVTINENADRDVVRDMSIGMNRAFPDSEDFRHNEGNSSAHLKSSNIGCTINIIIDNDELVLGTWQGIYLVEFDGPRLRDFYVKVIKD